MERNDKEYLSAFLRDYGYEPEAQAALMKAYDDVFSLPACREIGEDLRRLYGENRDCDFSAVLRGCERMAELSGVNVFTVNLLILILLTEVSKRHYAAEKIPEEIWRQNFADLKYKCAECRAVKGIWGTFVPWWYDRFFNVTRFAFGKLQFELMRFDHTYEKEGVILSPQDQAVNVHIPRTGEKLYPADVEDACSRADGFFRERFGLERTVFICHSWLLYPVNKQLLSKTSNLHDFISRFDLIDQGESADYSEVWRLFDTEYQGDPDRLPRDTSLRRAYAQRIKNGQPLGWGFGVWIYRRE